MKWSPLFFALPAAGKAHATLRTSP